MRFARQPIALARIAGDAGTNDVFPSGGSSAVTRHDVIQIQFAAIEKLAAVLARVLVPFEHVVPSKLYFFFRKPIEHQQHDHSRDTNFERNSCDYFVIRRVRRQIAPAFEIMSHEIVRLIGRNDLGMTRVYQRESAAG